MPVATLLGLGAVAVVLAAVVAVFVRQPDAPRSAAHRPSPPAVVSPAPQQRPTRTPPAAPPPPRPPRAAAAADEHAAGRPATPPPREDEGAGRDRSPRPPQAGSD